jgi:hypothetical protein
MSLNQKSSYYCGGTSFSGNVYAELELNIPIPVPGLSVNEDGAVDINLNTLRNNGLFNFLQSHPDKFAFALVTNTLPQYLASSLSCSMRSPSPRTASSALRSVPRVTSPSSR